MNPQRLQWFSTLLPLRRTDRVLEIGCGSGHLLALLAEQRSVGTLVGIDRSVLQVRNAIRRVGALPDPPTVLHLSLEDAPARFTGAPFSRIVAMNVNVIWTQPEVAGPALHALLAPRGALVFAFEPPTPSGSPSLQVKLARAAALSGFRLQTTYHDQASRTFAVEWTALPRRARTGASA